MFCPKIFTIPSYKYIRALVDMMMIIVEKVWACFFETYLKNNAFHKDEKAPRFSKIVITKAISALREKILKGPQNTTSRLSTVIARKKIIPFEKLRRSEFK